MSPTLLQFQPIASFPKPWAQQLSKYMGTVSFALERSSARPMPKQFLGVLSSHQHKHGDAFASWWSSLESALRLAKQQGWGVLCAGDAPYSKSVIHACRRLSVPRIELKTCSSQDVFADAVEESQSQDAGLAGRLWVTRTSAEAHASPRVAALPLRDLAVAFLADQAFALQVRKGGKIGELLHMRLACSEIPSASTYVSIQISEHKTKGQLDRRFRNSAENELLDEGAIGWVSKPASKSASSNSRNALDIGGSVRTYQAIASLEHWRRSFDRYLIHCTRARTGAWPDQSEDQFQDELLHRPWQSQPTPLETLTRILSQQRLIATNTCRRSCDFTVCFSAQPIDRLLSMRRYQSHLGRWDWEPYGLMIDREWLIEQGARQVQYVSASQAKTMNHDELAFTQVVGSSANAIDWTVEREWRLTHDVRLGQVPSDKAVVFVPTVLEARSIQHLSRWPVCVTT
jgi:hypothetical protein